MSNVVEYCGFEFEVQIDQKSWGSLMGKWGATIHFWSAGHRDLSTSRVVSGTFETAREAEDYGQRIAKLFIDDELAKRSS